MLFAIHVCSHEWYDNLGYIMYASMSSMLCHGMQVCQAMYCKCAMLWLQVSMLWNASMMCHEMQVCQVWMASMIRHVMIHVHVMILHVAWDLNQGLLTDYPSHCTYDKISGTDWRSHVGRASILNSWYTLIIWPTVYCNGSTNPKFRVNVPT